jgi:hypothetical protein
VSLFRRYVQGGAWCHFPLGSPPHWGNAVRTSAASPMCARMHPPTPGTADGPTGSRARYAFRPATTGCGDVPRAECGVSDRKLAEHVAGSR